MNKKQTPRLYSIVAAVSQADINRFGALHGTTGKTHTDPEYALQNGFGGTIVQGAFVMAPVVEMGHQLFGASWLGVSVFLWARRFNNFIPEPA